MIAIGVRYLNGWAMATHPADRERPEWPPHPDRVFMALAAAHFETGCDAAEATVLERLEREPPRLQAGRHEEREAVTSYVPVNDSASPLKGSGKTQRPLAPLGSLPIGRDRQARQFPVALPEEPVVHLRWPELDLDPSERGALAGLCAKVSRIGHSASLVQVWLDEATGTADRDGRPELFPVGSAPARYRLRVPSPGRLERLRADFAAGVRPRASAWWGYEPRVEPQAESTAERTTCFDPTLLVLRKIEGPSLGLESTLQVIKALRDTVLVLSPDPVEWVSGHRPDGSPSERDHLAFFPLPHVGGDHADGHLLGLALAVPREVDADERRRRLGPILFDELGHPKPIELRMGRLGLWQLQLEERDYRPAALRPETWTAAPPAEAAQRWATVTPIALDRHPKGADRWAQIEDAIRRGCKRIGLPPPRDVVSSPVSLFLGAPHGSRFPTLRRGAAGARVQHTHAVLSFDEPVRGPILVGAGRYRGYGVCRPLPREDAP